MLFVASGLAQPRTWSLCPILEHLTPGFLTVGRAGQNVLQVQAKVLETQATYQPKLSTVDRDASAPVLRCAVQASVCVAC